MWNLGGEKDVFTQLLNRGYFALKRVGMHVIESWFLSLFIHVLRI